MSLISLCFCFSFSFPLADGSPLIGCRTVRMASLTRVKCALWTGLCDTAWCFHDWVRLSMLSTLEKCSKCCCSLSHHSSYRSSSQPLPCHKSVRSHKSFSLVVSYQACICCPFLLSQRRGKWLVWRGCPQPFQVSRCLFSAWMMQLKLTSSVEPELMTGLSQRYLIFQSWIFSLHFLRVSQGVSEEREEKNKTKHEHVISTDELMSIFRVHLLVSSQVPLSSSIP